MHATANQKPRVLVTGATGQQGGAVTRHLLKRNFEVRALTRDPNKAAARSLTEQGVDVVQGDLNDRASVDNAINGVQGVFSVQSFWEVGFDGEVMQGKQLADAAKEANVEHFVYSSVGSAQHDTGIPHFDSKWQIEQHIREIGLPCTILRPVFFMDNWQMPMLRDMIFGGQLLQPLSPDTSLQQIAVDDIGAFAAMAFDDRDAWLGREVDLAGDELTMNDLVATFSRVIGRPVTYQQVPWDAFEQQMGPEYTVMYRWFEQVGYSADISALRQTHSGLKTLERFLSENNWQRAAA
ncbi:NmrA/HSCARG family protein [Phycisphaerales bacterium AB-hyl4]|uniref:NmrA/HSCARG family protein n=1 Tax=Natronomicrosphaera hydrolytica TaxID=3242702 RepID=A0ABV4U1H6_9BACT